MFFLINIILLFFCFAVLWYASEQTIYFCTDIARATGISNLFAGFVFLAFTSLPELMVAIQSLLADQPLLSAGNILGSNFAVIALAIGISTAFIAPITIDPLDQKKQSAILLISTLFMGYIFFTSEANHILGITLLTLYVIGIILLYQTRHDTHPDSIAQDVVSFVTFFKNGMLFKLIFFLSLVVISAKVAVDSAIDLAQFFNMPMSIIGATLFAAGTSLPEISLNIHALRQGNYGIALGNSLGSVFNQTFLILGILATAAPAPLLIRGLTPLFICMLTVFCTLLVHIALGKKIDRATGFFFVGIYGACMIYELLIYPLYR